MGKKICFEVAEEIRHHVESILDSGYRLSETPNWLKLLKEAAESDAQEHQELGFAEKGKKAPAVVDGKAVKRT